MFWSEAIQNVACTDASLVPPLTQLGAGLMRNTRLRLLDLSHNSLIGGEGTTDLAFFLGSNGTLVELSLRECGVDVAGAKTLKPNLSRRIHWECVRNIP